MSLLPNSSSTEIKAPRSIEAYMAAYEALRPVSELDARATLTLITSLALIGLSLASQKPDSVQVLGFNLQTEHWLLLAFPLAAVVFYATTQLMIAWLIEKHYKRYMLHGPINSMREELRLIHLQYLDKLANFQDESERMSEKRRDIWAWYKSKIRVLNDKEKELFDSNSAEEYDDRRESLSKARKKIETQLKLRMDKAGVTEFDYEVKDYLERRFDKGVPSMEEVLASKVLEHIRRIFWLQRIRVALGFYLPLAIAFFSIVTLAVAAVFPSWLSRTSLTL
ncbi:hypothetical protein [Halomonas chromatireducens]|uniref:Uncharacterized protein n=1 Tax=Halomonas chromatireducens TaxID=507626 RepID=A0A109UL62_9GAMM|nr:hypothetical protein [Halomonas chromatireducens]AMD00034.1 hypothetical protein LOKO_00957 [Halomonas chromatireducens]